MKSYRQGIAAVIINNDGYILSCERSDIKGAWQIPQGGIDNGESEEDALIREIKEETGLKDISIIGKTKGKYRYRFNLFKQILFRLRLIKHRGQEHRYFLVKTNNASAIDLQQSSTAEFRDYEWITSNELLDRIVKFKFKAYSKGINELKGLYSNDYKIM